MGVAWPALFSFAGEEGLPRSGRDTRHPPPRRLTGGAAPPAPDPPLGNRVDS